MANQPFSGNRPPYQKRFQNDNSKSKLRKNERIRVPEVRLIGVDGRQVGVVATREALSMAKQHGLDLVEVSPMAHPPVCRILDFGKYMYELSKKSKDSKPTTAKLKEIKFRIGTDTHDYMTKLRHAESFLAKGNKVKYTLMFRGREMEHIDLGLDLVRRAVVDIAHIGVADAEPRHMGRSVTAIVSPLPAQKRKLKYTTPDEDVGEEEDDDSEN